MNPLTYFVQMIYSFPEAKLLYFSRSTDTEKCISFETEHTFLYSEIDIQNKRGKNTDNEICDTQLVTELFMVLFPLRMSLFLPNW